MPDLVIKGARVIDPSQGLDRVADVVLDGGKVAAIEADVSIEQAREVVDGSGRIVVPGLIDLHTHVYWGGTSLGVDADALARRSGTTTFVDAGSAGAANFLGFRKHVIERSRARILAYLNVSFAGIFAFSRNVMVGENVDIRLCDAREALACAREHLDLLVGMKVRVGRVASGSNGAGPFLIALEVADNLQRPLMAHLDFPPPSRLEVVMRLRRGDVLTHCFRPFPNAPIRLDGPIYEEIEAARERGVIFDIGHGQGSFGFATARAMLRAGFLPDVISSDVHALCIDGPAFDLLVTMSKFLCLGVPLGEVVRAATVAPALAIGRPELGSLRPGSPGDVALLELREGAFDYVDVLGEQITGDRRLVCHGIAIGGSWWPAEEAA
jgi:dihydroorotase